MSVLLWLWNVQVGPRHLWLVSDDATARVVPVWNTVLYIWQSKGGIIWIGAPSKKTKRSRDSVRNSKLMIYHGVPKRSSYNRVEGIRDGPKTRIGLTGSVRDSKLSLCRLKMRWPIYHTTPSWAACKKGGRGLRVHVKNINIWSDNVQHHQLNCKDSLAEIRGPKIFRK